LKAVSYVKGIFGRRCPDPLILIDICSGAIYFINDR
jgi:hypothetical protein